MSTMWVHREATDGPQNELKRDALTASLSVHRKGGDMLNINFSEGEA